MNFKQSVQSSLDIADFLAGKYLSDFTDAELMMRPVPTANHVAWQLGHVIGAERRLVEAAAPGSMPELPAGFAERHSKEAASSDDPRAFLSKEEYLRIAKEVRAGTLAALEKLSEADFDKPVSGKLPPVVKRAGDCFVLIGPHWVGHAGQWVVLRRKLGRTHMF